ncbi:MAG: response regulator [Thermoplasmatales archaeon]|nr:MAG: response regulator [Thermoplasmatales archaeon]
MKKKVLIVDDNHDIIYSIKTELEDLIDVYEVVGANSGNECFELLEKGVMPDLILLEIMLTEMSGWDVFAKLKERPEWREIPIVFLTAKTDEYSKGFGMITAQDYIEKPFEIMDLKERIDKVLNK